MISGKSDQMLLGVPHQAPLPKWGRFIRALRKGYFVWPALLIVLLSLAFFLWSKATVTPTQPLGFSIKYLWLVPAVVILTASNLAIRWLRWHFLIRRFHLRLPTRSSLKLYAATLPTILTPLYLGELLRALLLRRGYPNAPRILCRIWLIERLADISILALFFLTWQQQWLVLFIGIGLAISLVLSLRVHFNHHPVSQWRTMARVITISIVTWLGLALGLQLVLSNLTSTPVSNNLFITVPALNMLGLDVLTLLQPHISKAAVLFQAVIVGTAIGVGLFAMMRWHRHLAALAQQQPNSQHFETIAPSYRQQIPDHIQKRLLTKKVSLMQNVLNTMQLPPNARGLDLGCGPGLYASHMARRGYTMSACDVAARQITSAHCQATAAQVNINPQVADARLLPYADNSFDFIYSINLIHHIDTLHSRRQAFAEIIRVLKPGGIFFLHEINTQNPLFAFYMGYLFPLLRNIDDGTECWIEPSALPALNGARWIDQPTHFTFLPDFTPRTLLPVLTKLEQLLERIAQSWSAHYMARLIKDSGS